MSDYRTKKAEYKVLFNEGLIINRDTERDYSKFIEGSAVNLIKGSNYSNGELLNKLSQTSKVTLSLTKNCNFRCTYCPHAGMYEHEKGYSKKTMSYDTAKKAVNWATLRKKNEGGFSKQELEVAFYGGEPLMAFELISKVVPYAKRRCQDLSIAVRFSVTTNGSLLTKHVVEFLIENDFLIFISLDGPKGEHDRFRVSLKQEPTWERVVANLNYIQTYNKEYFKSRVACQLTVSPLHDLDKIVEFIESAELFQAFASYSINWVKLSFMKPEYEKQYVNAA